MRGTIISWNGEKGVVAAADRRHEFHIDHWRANMAPASNMTVTLALEADQLVSVTPIDEAELAREKLNALSQRGTQFGRAVVSNVGKDIVIAYGAFAVSALFLNMIVGKGQTAVLTLNLPSTLNGLAMATGDLGAASGSGLLWVVLALASIAVPTLVKQKWAPLALCAPFLLTLYADWQIYSIYSMYKTQLAQAGSFIGGQALMAAAQANLPGLGLGAYGTALTSAYLAYRGVMRFRQAG